MESACSIINKSDHLSVDRLEEYVLNRNTMEELNHLAKCAMCRDRLLRVRRYVSAMKSAAARLMNEEKTR